MIKLKMFLNYLRLRFDFSLTQVPEVKKRFSLLKKAIGVWVLLSILPNLIFYDIAYEIDFSREPDKYLLILFFNILPGFLKSYLIQNAYIITVAVGLLTVPVCFKKQSNVLSSFLFFVLMNIHLMINSRVNSGATSIVANCSTYIFIFNLITGSSFKYKDYLEQLIFQVLKIQLCIVYLISGLVKLTSPLWMGGFATFYIFRVDRYFRFVWVTDLFDKFDFLYSVSSYLPIIFLISFPVLIWTRFKNKLVILSFCFHGFIALFMGLREFMIFPVLSLFLFYDPIYGPALHIDKPLQSKVLKMFQWS